MEESEMPEEEKKRDTPVGLSEEVKLPIGALSASVQQMLKFAGLLDTGRVTP